SSMKMNEWTGRLLLLGFLWCLAASPTHAASGSGTPDAFQARVYTNNAGKTLNYRLLLPLQYDPQQAYPVILYLHGAAARGDDNTEPLNWGPRLFLDPALREKHPFFLVVPQCPRSEGWLESVWSGLGGLNESRSLALSLDLV